MQTRSTNPDHHHQAVVSKAVGSFPEADLVALARGKGQILTSHTLRLISETLEIRGVSLSEFVVEVRPHFRNNILNPSGFLINHARHFHKLSRPAEIFVPPAPTIVCEGCNGQRFVIEAKQIVPCPECSTAEFRREWETKEAERERKRRGTG